MVFIIFLFYKISNKMKQAILYIFICINFTQVYTSDHNHTQQHDKQISRMFMLGLLLDNEVEKAEKGLHLKILHHKKATSLGSNKYLSAEVRIDLPPDFRGILKAMNRLNKSMVCPRCQKKYRDITDENIQKVKTIQEKLTTGELPKIDNERGHYA